MDADTVEVAWADQLQDCPVPGVIDVSQMARVVAAHLGNDDGRPLTLVGLELRGDLP